MLRRLVAVAAAGLMLAGDVLPAAPPAHPALARGLALMREGDFEAAVLELDAAARTLEADPASERHRPWAYVYLGVAYLELEQEAVARGKFREALAREPGLVLLPAEFSAQSIRVFEDVRAAAAAAAAPVQEPAAPRPRPGVPTTPPPEKKGSKGPLVAVLLGGAAAAGAAVALGGGEGGDSATTTTTVIAGGSTTLPGPTPSPTEPPSTTTPGAPTTTTPGPTTTTTQPPATTLPACTYTVNGPTPLNPYLQVGGAGTCSVQTQGGCRWTAESNRPWISASGSASGSGIIQFTLAPNPDAGTRNGSIFLAESPSASCPIQQRGLLSLQESTEPAAAVWISDLDMEGAAGQVIVDGSSVSYQARAAVTLAVPGGTGVHRVEALVVTAAGRPGTWRFQLPAGATPGSLRVVAGDVSAITSDTVIFRLAGRPGERLVFTFAHR